MEIGLTPHDAPDGGLHYVVSGKGADFPMSEGLAGGYPGAPNSYIWVKNNEAEPDPRNADAGFARSVDDLPGDQERISWGVFPLMGDDVLYLRWNGGGGYGDPLDREPETVLEDCRTGAVSRETAENVYGVVIDESLSSFDPSATEARRKALAAARIPAEAAE